MDTPEEKMKKGFEHFFKARKCFEEATKLYKERNDSSKADPLNYVNTLLAIDRMNEAYDEISEIYENDINV